MTEKPPQKTDRIPPKPATPPPTEMPKRTGRIPATSIHKRASKLVQAFFKLPPENTLG